MAYYGVAPVAFGSVSMVTATLGPNDPELGTVREEGANKYILVYSSNEISKGRCATLSGVSGYTVTVSTADREHVLGVCKHTTLTTGTYGWLLTRGFTPIMASAAVSIATGNLLYAAANGFFANVVHSGATQTGEFVVGKCVESSASAASIGVGFITIF